MSAVVEPLTASMLYRQQRTQIDLLEEAARQLGQHREMNEEAESLLGQIVRMSLRSVTGPRKTSTDPESRKDSCMTARKPRKLVRGLIVWAETPDPAGRNPKERPVVLLTSEDEVPAGNPLIAVGITGTLATPL